MCLMYCIDPQVLWGFDGNGANQQISPRSYVITTDVSFSSTSVSDVPLA